MDAGDSWEALSCVRKAENRDGILNIVYKMENLQNSQILVESSLTMRQKAFKTRRSPMAMLLLDFTAKVLRKSPQKALHIVFSIAIPFSSTNFRINFISKQTTDQFSHKIMTERAKKVFRIRKKGNKIPKKRSFL